MIVVRPRIHCALAGFALALAVVGNTAHAQVTKPFTITGGGVADYIPLTPLTPANHYAVGRGTDLGLYHGNGSFQVLALTSPTTADFDSAKPFVFCAEDGSKLVCTYGNVNNHAAQPGHVTLTPVGSGLVMAVFVAEFNPVVGKCTGRFAKVVGGGWIMTAVSLPFVPGGKDPVGYSWGGSGNLIFRR